MSVKKQILRALAFVLILSSIAAMFTGCGSNRNTGNAYRSIAGADLESQLIASDSESELHWDLDAKAVLYKSVENGEYWSDILYDAFLDGSTSANGNSPITITVVDAKTFKYLDVTSYSQQGKMNIVCKKIENGIRVTYFFETYKIAVPIEYTLKDGALNVAIVTSNILEDGEEYKLYSVSLAPYLCSVANDAENGNLLVPTGTGALMNTAVNADGTRTYTAEVYGEDAANRSPYDKVESEYARLPVFGAYGNGKGIFAVIEEGSAAASITANAGNSKLGYSNVYATFYLRGQDTFVYYYHGEYQGVKQRVNENLTTEPLSVTYYTLYGEDADYNGMAELYRNYLTEKGELTKSETANSAYSVTFWGGTGITESILGIPNKKISPLTTFSQAQAILEDLNKNIGALPSVRMMAYGDNGLRAGTIAGGKKYLSAYGSKKDLTSLLEYASNTSLFMDSDIVYFGESGAGISKSSDTALSAVLYKSEHFAVTPIRVYDETNVQYAVSRLELANAAKVAFKKAKKYGNTGISFSSLGENAYSDYSDDKYISGALIEEDVKEILNSAKKQGYTTAVAGANAYAACAADMLFDVATDNGNYSVFDKEIPFYQLVFHSYKPMYSTSINFNENTDYAVARAVAYGMGLGYTLTNGYVDESDDLDEYKLYATVYEDNADLISETLVNNGYLKIYDATKDATISNYTMVSDGVSATTYSNGVTVYVNHTNKAVTSPVGELAPYAYSMS